jgi:acylphosphatase
MLRRGLGRSPSDYLDAVVTAARDCSCRSLYRHPAEWQPAPKPCAPDGRGEMHSVRHVMIRGRVQGVGYRAWTEVTALEHGLEGWVRNRRDGAVEALFAGPKPVVAAMIEACRRGPPGARVDAVDEIAARPDLLALRRAGELFSVLATA